MFFPRLGAAICVLVLIGGVAAVAIGGLLCTCSTMAYGSNVAHADGKIVKIGPGKDFVLEAATKQKWYFQCRSDCRASLSHMQRHLREGAHTDVYYQQISPHDLMAIYVD
jgi:hypothetical protein